MHAREEAGRTKGRTAPARPRPATGAMSSAAASMLDLQRTAGNAAVSRSLSSRGQQAPLTVQRAGGRQSKYEDGTYGARNRERHYLETEYDEDIDGNRTHQAEHPILYSAAAPSNRTGVRRGQSGQAGGSARYVENNLPAYYETFREHRDHDGTGTRPADAIGTTGLRQSEYRDSQRRALEEANNPATAMHMNMIGYANQRSFRNPAPTTAIRQSDASYERMLSGSGRSPYFDSAGSVRTTRSLIPQERADLYAGRRVARGEPYPDAAQQDRVMRRFGARSHQLRSQGSGGLAALSDYPDLGSDRSQSPHELDTSYRQRSRSRARSRSRGPVSQREQLRRLARGRDVTVGSDSFSYGGGATSVADSELSRGRSRSRQRAQSRALSRSRTRTRASSTAPSISDAYSYLDDNATELPRGRSRSRRRSQSRAVSRSRTRTRASSTAPSISDAYSYLDDNATELPRGRSRSRSRGRQRSQSRVARQYGGPSSVDFDVTGSYDYGSGNYDDEPVYSQSAPRRRYDY
ncbi:hypothetical protein [Streptomyces sp. NBC_01190]|uniref:hypothetical protein n=1 Tax=Streptomyces sp. NBC_01190 TaxID=2903767 RepID=UPI003864DD50|nr:hypothetical protein OG519_13820 [Streptomyces sp. NBC_01190]